MRSILRAILAFTLLLGGLGGDWAPAAMASAHECCCGEMPALPQDACPCPKPEGNRTPSRGACAERQAVVAQTADRRAEQGRRRTEPRPEPARWARAAADLRGTDAFPTPTRGRDPDLGRHLAQLSTHRI